ncbi:MAG: ATP-binding protein, partial [Chloroflexi bacterium]|nr:ATP-binding protein [Chloroflexota bacterium]
DDNNEQAFFQIQGLSNFWKGRSDAEFGQHIVDLVIGIHNQQQSDLLLVLLGSPRKLSVFLSLGNRDATQTILEGIFPGIILKPIATRDLIERLPAHFLAQGVITGVPSSKTVMAGAASADGQAAEKHGQSQQAAGNQGKAQLERVIRGMHGKNWAYVVKAHSRPRHKVVEERMMTIDMLTQVTNHSRMQWQSTKQENQQVTSLESGGVTQSYSGDIVNYRAQYLIRLLERELERLDQAAAAGQWTAGIFFGADSNESVERLAALLLGTLAGPDSRPEPLRTSICQRRGQSLDAFHTFLTSQEVAALIQLPREEVPGYAIHDHVIFDVDFQMPDAESLPLGTIQQDGRDTQDTFNITLDALAKHVVVIGVTGSGKTTTVMNLLDHAAQANKPFLVIEPAKTEYRSLHSALPPGQQLRVYTLGNELVAPFRLNPFEFETGDDPENSSLLTHIDFLKAVFNAAFVLYSPMPQVLEEALHEIYEDRGWDLTSGINRRLPDWSERHKYPIFPTLTDLYYKVEEVTNRLGYDREVESNIKAGLKTRIGSLRIGSKGLMLDTARSIPIRTLLSTPTVLELEGIGSDDEKTFLMGLFLTRLYEYRRLQASVDASAKGLSSHGLKHLMVFEEAHRLLQNTSTQVGVESSNPRAQAIEVFTNMLSEMRAYGQGVLVAEQIPSKLAPDVLKNTNLKLVHRLIAQDDRQSIGQTMNLNEEQQTHLTTLSPGMAAVYAEGADHAYLVRMENYKRKISALIDADLRKLSRRYATVKHFQAIMDFDKYEVPLAPLGGPDPATYYAAGKLLDSEKSKRLWARFLLCLTSNPAKLLELITGISEQIETEMPHLSAEQHDRTMRMTIVRGSAEIMRERGAQFGWTYTQEDDMRVLLTNGMLTLARVYCLIRDQADQEQADQVEMLQKEMEQSSNYFKQFVTAYETSTQRRQGPFAGCIHCPAKCLYRVEVNSLLSPRERSWLDQEFTNPSYESKEARIEAVAQMAVTIAQAWLSDSSSDPNWSTFGISYCTVLHNVAKADVSEYEQIEIGDQIKRFLLA